MFKFIKNIIGLCTFVVVSRITNNKNYMLYKV